MGPRSTTIHTDATVEAPDAGFSRKIRALRLARWSGGAATARVLLLPAGEGSDPRLGDGFATAVEWLQGSPVSVEIVYPEFRTRPGWFADRPAIDRHPESAIVALARHWRSTDPLPLYLMGFSKSGYAALSLLARHQDQQLFSGAASWDAPLMLQEISSNNMLGSYGHAASFDAYCVDRKIHELKSAVEVHHAGIILCGYSAWGRQMQEYHGLLVEAGVAHECMEARRSWHRWDRAWMGECLDALLLFGGNKVLRENDGPGARPIGGGE